MQPRFNRVRFLRGTVLVASVVAILGGLGADDPAGKVQVENTSTIRLLAYNIKHGQGTDDRVDLERAARVINSLAPDLLVARIRR